MRFALGGNNASDWTRCRDITGGGVFEDNTFAVGWVPPNGVVVSLDSYLYLVDIDTDEVVWSTWTDRLRALDAFGLVSPEGETLVTVAFTTHGSGGDGISTLHTYRNAWDATEPVDTWFASALTLGSNNESFTRSPDHPGCFLTVRYDMYAARRVCPFTGEPNTDYIGDFSAANLSTIASLGPANPTRFVWTGTRIGPDASAMYAYDGDGTETPVMVRTPTSRTCIFLDALPDPTHDDGFIAICQDPSTTMRDIVRFREGDGSYAVLASEAVLDEDEDFTDLAMVTALP